MTKTPERPLHEYLKDVRDGTGVRAGSALPLGTSQQENGGNFAFFSLRICSSQEGNRLRIVQSPSPWESAPVRFWWHEGRGIHEPI
jgi:hypothetical protein